MKRAKGATLAQIVEATGWQKHTIRGFVSLLGSKGGEKIESSKNAAGESALRAVFEQNRGRLVNNTRLTADINLPELTADRFIALYPLLPYQIDLIIQVVSGLRTQGGAARHVGGANRTIIKLAQQLLINPAVALGEASVESIMPPGISSSTVSEP